MLKQSRFASANYKILGRSQPLTCLPTCPPWPGLGLGRSQGWCVRADRHSLATSLEWGDSRALRKSGQLHSLTHCSAVGTRLRQQARKIICLEKRGSKSEVHSAS